MTAPPALTCTRNGCGRTVTVEAAAEFVRAHGRLPACACEPTRATARPRTDIGEHGSRGYWRGCKCAVCRAGHAAYQRDHRAQQSAAS